MTHLDKDFEAKKRRLIEELQSQGVRRVDVLDSIRNTPRQCFVDESLLDYAYENRPLPIRHEQTISQPYIVALMTAAALGEGDDVRKVLEIGTGSGYQAAVLAHCVETVFTVERIAALQERAKAVLHRLNINNVRYLCADGTEGWAEEAPYDAILVTANATEIPEALKAQLKIGGRLVIPVGRGLQILRCLTRRAEDDWLDQELEYVRFVPLRKGHVPLE